MDVAFPAFFALLDVWMIHMLRVGEMWAVPTCWDTRVGTRHSSRDSWHRAPTRAAGDGFKHPRVGFDLLKHLLGQISSKKWLLRNRREIKVGSYNSLRRQENDKR